MKKRILLICLLSGMLPTLQGAVTAPLAARWKAWLDEDVVTIITAKEREVFLALKSDKERETFEEAFWLQRDPTPGTPDNEFKVEHFRRLKYADNYYGRSSMRRGRDTDRGRMYILLGEPISTQRFEEGAQNLNPSELWQYQGDTSMRLPPFFYLLFYKPDPNSDYRLYSPSFDGPDRLIQGSAQGNYDRQGAYELLKNASAELAEASLTLIPGTGADASSTVSSLSSDFLISDIRSLPDRKVKSAWAAAFAKHSEIITTDHSINFLAADSALFVHQANGLNLLHAVIEPRRLSMIQYENKVYAPLKLNIKMADKQGGLIHQEEKEVPVEVAQSDFAGVSRRVAAIGDVLPLVEGQFVMSYLLRNTESKEFSSFEETIVSPGAGAPSLSPLLVLYDVKPVPQGAAGAQGATAGVAPFVFGENKVFPNTSKTLAEGEPLHVYFEIYNPGEATGSGSLRFSIDGETANVLSQEEAVGGRRYFVKTFPRNTLQPGYYSLNVALIDASGGEIASSKERFAISMTASLPRPWRYDKLYPPLAHPYYAMVRAYEYLGLGDHARAASMVEPFYDPANPNAAFALLLARAYFEMKRDDRVVAVLRPAQKLENAEANLLLGKSLYRLGGYADALPVLEAAMGSIGQTVELLNLIGTACLKLGETERGLSYLVRSLEVNPDQPEIRKAVEAAGKH
jgi:GWxTD domain-containing protein